MDRIMSIVGPAIPETLIMIGVSSLIAIIFGIPLGVQLYLTRKGGLKENLGLYRILDGIINIFRSLPFMVLMFILFPLTRLIVGTRIGVRASIVPLSVSAIPFLARVVEGNLLEIDTGIIEAARAMGTDTNTIVKKVLLSEALPQIVSSITLMIINLIGQSAVVGAIGGGGLGDVAIRYGYQRNQMDMLWASCIAIIILVQLVQFIGNRLAKSLDKRV